MGFPKSCLILAGDMYRTKKRLVKVLASARWVRVRVFKRHRWKGTLPKILMCPFWRNTHVTIQINARFASKQTARGSLSDWVGSVTLKPGSSDHTQWINSNHSGVHSNPKWAVLVLHTFGPSASSAGPVLLTLSRLHIGANNRRPPPQEKNNNVSQYLRFQSSHDS